MHPIQFYDVCICEHEGLTAFPIYFNPAGCVKKKLSSCDFCENKQPGEDLDTVLSGN